MQKQLGKTHFVCVKENSENSQAGLANPVV